jgi:hypothetical protein
MSKFVVASNNGEGGGLLPIIVTIAGVLLSLLTMETLLKFGLAAVIAVPMTWGVAYLVRRIPFANRML